MHIRRVFPHSPFISQAPATAAYVLQLPSSIQALAVLCTNRQIVALLTRPTTMHRTHTCMHAKVHTLKLHLRLGHCEREGGSGPSVVRAALLSQCATRALVPACVDWRLLSGGAAVPPRVRRAWSQHRSVPAKLDPAQTQPGPRLAEVLLDECLPWARPEKGYAAVWEGAYCPAPHVEPTHQPPKDLHRRPEPCGARGRANQVPTAKGDALQALAAPGCRARRRGFVAASATGLQTDPLRRRFQRRSHLPA